MFEVRQLRNDFQHDGFGFQTFFEPGKRCRNKNNYGFRLCRDINDKLSKGNIDKSKK
jgi:hypothetical protein